MLLLRAKPASLLKAENGLERRADSSPVTPNLTEAMDPLVSSEASLFLLEVVLDIIAARDHFILLSSFIINFFSNITSVS
jgi:hypothetical protein